MSKSKLYFLFLILIFNISSISSLIADDHINFNLGRSIEENLISNVNSASDKINSEPNILNLDQKITDKIINKINSNNIKNSIRNINDQKNTSNISTNKESRFFKYFNYKNNPINWYNSYLSESDIQNRIISQDISISPSSVNLPSGNGTVEMGEKVYQSKCLSCHGTEGKAEELDQEVESLRGGQNSIKIIAFESLSGGLGSLNSEMPIRSVGSFWQHSTTLFDYIRRAMPYFEPQSLTNDEAYAVTAYVLFINNIITKDQNINADTLQKINMPNKAGFIDSWGPDWWRSWIHQKYSIIFTCFLLIGILLVILFARKLTQNKKYINIIKILLTTTIFSWIGIFHGIPIGTQKVYNSYNDVKLNNGDWENILFEPIFVILSSFVIITTLIWGRGIFCGWICPFGTIQDMIYKFKSFFKFITFEVPNNLHNKLIYTKYIILAAIVISAIYTSGNNLLMEFEPFKTIIENKFNTSTILILWSLVLLSFVFFIERGFCRYLCPTGAALSLTSQFQVINWLTSIKANGSKDSLAFAPRCPTKAIKSDGSINEKECILCLSCQIVYNDKNLSKRNKSSIRKKRNNNSPVLGKS
ncbi:MAG: 4Fe-4S binding protein [Alphaproteobacteria bacterium]|nr:4Fe-4S binding protein [Alphaproteobacteria bacterium]